MEIAAIIFAKVCFVHHYHLFDPVMHKFILILLIWAMPASVFPATTGKIAGFVRDANTGDPLAGVNIQVRGTELYAVSGLNGEYFILNVPIGVYRVEAQMIGYLPVHTEGVRVNTDLTTRLPFSLEINLLDINQPITITAPKSAIRSDLTSSSDVLDARELQPLPVTDLSELILLQNGVVRDAQGDLHVRGGRNDELSYYVDGANLQDPLLGGLGTHIQLDSVEELVVNRGGFDAQYGDAMSGMVNIVTKEGRRNLSGRFRMLTNLQQQYDVNRGDYGGMSPWQGGRIEGMLSGALPRLGDRGGFFISGQRMTDGLHIPHNQRTLTTVAGNLVYKPKPLLKLKLSGHFSRRRQMLYDHRDQNCLSYDFNLDGLPERRDHSYAVNLSLNHTVTPSTFYTARLYRYTTASKLAPTMLFDEYWSQWPGYETDKAGKYVGSIFESNLQPSTRFEGLPFTEGEDFFPVFRQARTTYYGLRLDVSSQITFRNQLRAGLETLWYKLDWDERSFLQATPSGQQYAANPVEGAFYIQDKMELSALTVNAGLRMDYFDTGQRFFVNLPNGQTELRNSPTKIRFSPRIGLSHRFTGRSLLRFSYGYFFQPPEFRFAYENLQRDLSGEFPTVGNPNLDPQKTVAYELGVEHALTDHIRIGTTGSYKKISNLTSTSRVQFPGGSYSIFTNADFGTVYNAEFFIRRDISRLLSGSLNYTYSNARGSSTTPQETSSIRPSSAGQNFSPLPVVFPLAFDQRHTLTGVVSIITPDNWRTRFLGLPLNGWSLSLIGYMGSGLPYTPTNSLGEQTDTKPNLARLPSLVNMDLRLKKRIRFRHLSYTFFSEVRNVLNRRNIIRVYANTGDPDDDGYTLESLDGKSTEFSRLRRLLSLDPQHYSPPREFRIGFEVGF